MSEYEIYDYLETVAPDKAVTLTTVAQQVIKHRATRAQAIHTPDEGPEERVGLSEQLVIDVTAIFKKLTAAEQAEIMDMFLNTDKGNIRLNSFYWSGHTDGHTYVVRFNCDAQWDINQPTIYGYPAVDFRVLGRKAD